MVLVLPRKPGLAELAGQGLGSAIGGAGQGFFEGLQQKKEREQKEHRFRQLFPNTNQEARTNDLASQQPRSVSQPMNTSISDEAIARIGEDDMQLAKLLQEQKKGQLKEKSERSKQHFEIAKDALKEVEHKAQGLPLKELALNQMQEAIQEGNLSFFSGNNLAELTGIEAFRDPKGALFKAAGKEYFLGNLSRIGAKGINQWIERQVLDMMPKIGYSKPANLIVTELLKVENDITRKQIELTNEIADRQEQQFGGPRRNLSSEVMKELTPYVLEKQKELKVNIQDIKDRYQSVNKEGRLMIDPAGETRRVSAKDIKAARSAGYKDA